MNHDSFKAELYRIIHFGRTKEESDKMVEEIMILIKGTERPYSNVWIAVGMVSGIALGMLISIILSFAVLKYLK